MISPEKAKAFIDELTELSRKHGIILDSCGCCNSIFLGELDTANTPWYTSKGKYYMNETELDQINWEKTFS